jgi:hypothetical protein
MFPTLDPGGFGGGPSLFSLFPATALHDGLNGQPGTGTSAQALTPQDAAPPSQDTEEAKAAQQKIHDIMGDYDPEDGDSDEKAQQIANDPNLCKYLTKEQRAELVKGLFDGDTGEDEEDAAMTIIRSGSPDDVKWVVGNIGWEDIEDELDSEDLTEINRLMAQPSSSETDKVFEEAGVTENDAMEEAQFDQEVQDSLNGMSQDELQALAAKYETDKAAILKEISDLERRGKGSKARRMKHVIEALSDKVADPLVKSRMKQLSFEVQYTSDISSALARGDYQQLVKYLPTLVDPNVSKEQRVALFETLRRHEDQFKAMEAYVDAAGTGIQKEQMRQFTNTKKAFMDSFNPNVPPKDVLQQVLDKIKEIFDGVISEFNQLKAGIDDLAKKLTELNIDHLMGSDTDDKAEDIAGSLFANNYLDDLPTELKAKLIRDLNDGPTGDAQEQRILEILRTTKEHNRDEFYQLVAAVGWDELDSNIDGEEWDDFMKLMDQ